MTNCTSLVVHPTVGHLKLHNYSWLTEEISLNPVKTIFFSDRDFQSAGKKSAKIKCLLFSPKPQKFHTAEITGYTVTKMLFNVALTVVTITLND
jgi:hypothetical protein